MSSGKQTGSYLAATERRRANPKAFVLRNESAKHAKRTKDQPISLPSLKILNTPEEECT